MLGSRRSARTYKDRYREMCDKYDTVNAELTAYKLGADMCQADYGAMKRKADELVVMCKEKDETIQNYVKTMRSLCDMATATKIVEVIRHGDPDGDGGYIMPDKAIDIDNVLSTWVLEVSQEEERIMRVRPYEQVNNDAEAN